MSSHKRSLEDRALARVGSLIHEKYRLERLLGIGGMAAVYAGSHRNGNRVALKVLHPELGIDADVRARFLREGYVANKVDHPGAVRVLDDDTTDDGAVFLVMELLDGEGLDARAERAGGRLSLDEVCAIARQLLAVLAAAHERNVVHRDIKPENLFVTTSGVLKVLDFGIARLRESETSRFTGTGRTMGTPAYMPPEQARGRRSEVDGRTDIWTVGATMFTLLSGKYVHHGAETTEELLVFAATQPVTPLAESLPEVPREIAAVIDRALAFSKTERWPGAAPMGEALAEAFLASRGRPLSSVTLTAMPDLAPATPSDAQTTERAAIVAGHEETQPAAAVDRPVPARSTAEGSARASTLASPSAPASVARRRAVLVGAGAAIALVGAGGAAAWSARKSNVVSPAAVAAAEASVAPAAAVDSSAILSAAPPATGAPTPAPLAGALAPATSRSAPLPPLRLHPSPHALHPAASTEDCSLESYVETVKGEPVTRFRRVCR